MKIDVMRFIFILVIIVVFSLFVYPTPYKYFAWDNMVPIKHNWITGKTYFYTPNDGWKNEEE